VTETPGQYGHFFEEYAEVFTGLGCVPGIARIATREDVQPVVERCRKVPFGLDEALKKELDRMVIAMNVISKVTEPTEWVSSIVVVMKPNGKIRVCLDPQNLNRAIRREHLKLPY
jgi:hypothetical protein